MLDLLLEKKFEDITIKDVTDKANVGRRTFYHHYLDKYDLIEKMISEHLECLHEICDESTKVESNPQELLWFSYFEKHYNFFSIMISNVGKLAFNDTLYNFVKDELLDMYHVKMVQDQGIEKDLYATFCASEIVGVIEHYFTDITYVRNTDQFSEQVMQLLDRLNI